ncbi:MAG TPA: hypothetical protein VK509_07785 [Polyangiales bacterium]|nr:hypothetical protein [Polyangiales bacterium]
MRSLAFCGVFAVCVGLAACSSDDDDAVAAPNPGHDASTAPPNDGPGKKDAATHPVKPPAIEPDDEVELGDDEVLDRCIVEPCKASKLPEQPALEFLEDMGEGWQRLMEVDWQLAAGAEGYRCMTFTVPKDTFITAFAPQVPLGTHHATFAVNIAPGEPDRVYSCGVGGFGDRRLQGAGAGSEPTELPDGVAMPVRAGNQILMNLHLFNVSEQPLTGRSGMWVKTVPSSEVVHEAETVLAGPRALEIPVGRSTQPGSCTLRADATLYAVAPHMHQKGVHFRATATTAGGERMIYDGDYDFSHQLLHDIDDLQLKSGDRVNLQCTYENDTDGTLYWGDSSTQEMCFIGLNLYPAGSYGGLPCSD